MRGVLLVPSSSSPTLPLIYDGLDVSVTSNITWVHSNHDMVSRRIYKLSFYGEHSITYTNKLLLLVARAMGVPHNSHSAGLTHPRLHHQ